MAHDLANPLGASAGLAGRLAGEPVAPDDLRVPAGSLDDRAGRALAVVRACPECARQRPGRRVGRPVRLAVEDGGPPVPEAERAAPAPGQRGYV